MKPLRVAVIGAGVMGQRHIETYLSHPLVHLTYVVDIDQNKLDTLYADYDFLVETSYKKIVEEVDAVSITTPTSTHFQIAEFFLSKGKHVLVEKPVTNNVDNALEIIRKAEENNVVLAIGHIERFNPVIDFIKTTLENNKPLYIKIQREGSFDPRIYDSDVILDLMIHDLDLLYYMLNEKLEISSALGTEYCTSMIDIGNVNLYSQSGIHIYIKSSRAASRKSRYWLIVFENYCLHIDLINYGIYKTSNRVNYVSLEKHKITTSKSPLQLEIEDFISAIYKKTQPRTDGYEGLKALELAMGIQDTIRGHQLKSKIIL